MGLHDGRSAARFDLFVARRGSCRDRPDAGSFSQLASRSARRRLPPERPLTRPRRPAGGERRPVVGHPRTCSSTRARRSWWMSRAVALISRRPGTRSRWRLVRAELAKRRVAKKATLVSTSSELGSSPLSRPHGAGRRGGDLARPRDRPPPAQARRLGLAAIADRRAQDRRDRRRSSRRRRDPRPRLREERDQRRLGSRGDVAEGEAVASRLDALRARLLHRWGRPGDVVRARRVAPSCRSRMAPRRHGLHRRARARRRRGAGTRPPGVRPRSAGGRTISGRSPRGRRVSRRDRSPLRLERSPRAAISRRKRRRAIELTSRSRS
jgi:hypothetical protein